MTDAPPPPAPEEPGPEEQPAPSAWDEPWDRPSERNTGLPASTPHPPEEWAPPPPRQGASTEPGQLGQPGQGWGEPRAQWGQPPGPQEQQAQQWGQPEPYARPAFGPPDPAAVSGPPWPVLVAVGHYVPPRMIRWPIIVGFLAIAAWIGIIVAVSGSSTISNRVWLADHIGTINAINQDQRALAADNPAHGGSATKWLADWDTFHNDIATAATLPSPGGSATVPWREMINDYFSGSSEIVQAVRTSDQALLVRAERSLVAGDEAAHRFDSAMGLAAP